jgi:sugar (pentulose or hexulose) kinase
VPSWASRRAAFDRVRLLLHGRRFWLGGCSTAKQRCSSHCSLSCAGLLYRAALEGTSFSLYGGYLAMKRLGVEVTELRVVGGGSKNPLWRQILADVFQVRLQLRCVFSEQQRSAAVR